jgi:hypothetical protein
MRPLVATEVRGIWGKGVSQVWYSKDQVSQQPATLRQVHLGDFLEEAHLNSQILCGSVKCRVRSTFPLSTQSKSLWRASLIEGVSESSYP